MSGLFRRLSSRRSAGPEGAEPAAQAEPGAADTPTDAPAEPGGHRSLLADPAGASPDPAGPDDRTRVLRADDSGPGEHTRVLRPDEAGAAPAPTPGAGADQAAPPQVVRLTGAEPPLAPIAPEPAPPLPVSPLPPRPHPHE